MLMRRLYALVLPDLEPEVELPPKGTLTHLLHLAPHGQILPHVDNLDASGSVILGLSLGAPRILRLEHKDEKTGWDVLLPSGSVYLQKSATISPISSRLTPGILRGINMSTPSCLTITRDQSGMASDSSQATESAS